MAKAPPRSGLRVARRLQERVYEGVPYRRYAVSFQTTAGKRVRVHVWSPGQPWLREEVSRMLGDRGDVRPGSDVVVKEDMRR